MTYALLYIFKFLRGQNSVLELCAFLFRYPARYPKAHTSMGQYRIPSAKRDPGRQRHILVPESIPADLHNQLITCLYVRARTFESIDGLYDLIKRQVSVHAWKDLHKGGVDIPGNRLHQPYIDVTQFRAVCRMVNMDLHCMSGVIQKVGEHSVFFFLNNVFHDISHLYMHMREANT